MVGQVLGKHALLELLRQHWVALEFAWVLWVFFVDQEPQPMLVYVWQT